jgi:hypothetical protein
MEINKSKFSTYKDIKNYFEENKIKNVILFSQARSGSTFATDFLSNYLKFEKKNIYPENYFLNRHFSYLREFVKKHDNFFLNVNEFIYKRIELKKESTLFIYLFRDHEEIKKSYKKATENNYYMGWNEFYTRYKVLYPDINQDLHVSLFNHLIWQKQISSFNHALTLNFNSFKDFKNYIHDRSKFKGVGQQNLNVIKNYANIQNRINFNIFEKLYFFCRRKFESRKKNIKNY